METTTLSQILRNRIEELGGVQATYAARIGVSPQHLSQLLKSKIALPQAELRRRIAADLGMSSLDLLVMVGELTIEEAQAGASGEGVLFTGDSEQLALARRIKALDQESLDRLSDFITFLESGSANFKNARRREREQEEQ